MKPSADKLEKTCFCLVLWQWVKANGFSLKCLNGANMFERFSQWTGQGNALWKFRMPAQTADIRFECYFLPLLNRWWFNCNSLGSASFFFSKNSAFVWWKCGCIKHLARCIAIPDQVMMSIFDQRLHKTQVKKSMNISLPHVHTHLLKYMLVLHWFFFFQFWSSLNV